MAAARGCHRRGPTAIMCYKALRLAGEDDQSAGSPSATTTPPWCGASEGGGDVHGHAPRRPRRRSLPATEGTDLRCGRPARKRPTYTYGPESGPPPPPPTCLTICEATVEPGATSTRPTALKLLVEEEESDALARAIDGPAAELVGCWLLDDGAASSCSSRGRPHPGARRTSSTESTCTRCPASLFREAGLLPGPNLRSLDALHLAAAVRIGVDHLVTYDVRMSESARALGVSVLSPA